MRVAVIGAGVAGLAAARELQKHGYESIVFEAEPDVGGRVETARIGGYVFDTGATTIAPRGRSLEDALFRELDDSDLVQIELPIYIHSSLHVSVGDPAKNRIERYTYQSGNDALPRLLARGLQIRLSTRVERIERDGDGFEVAGECFDAVILAVPTPESTPILAALQERRPFSNAMYRPCLSVLLGYAVEPPSVAYHALVEPENSHPLSWLSLESLKCPGRSPKGKTAVVAQLGPQFSKLNFEAADQSIVDATADLLARLYGKAWDLPEVAAVRRWVYSQPEMTALFDNVNRPGSRLLIAGDGVMGGRIEYAYESGVRAAAMLIGGPNEK